MMPRNMSFSLTTDQIRRHTKTVTRRVGWNFLSTGDRLWAVEKSMGLKKGEKVKRLALIEVVQVWRQRLSMISEEDVAKEGFPGWTPDQFIRFLISQHPKLKRRSILTRIEFRYVDQGTTEEHA